MTLKRGKNPMKLFRRHFLACVLCLLFSSKASLFAQSASSTSVPPFFNYTGTLIDASGKPRTGVVALTFSLYADQKGGAPLWIDTQTSQLDDSGRFSVVLGAAGKSLPLDLFTAGQPRWLGVQPQILGEGEQPRALLVSVPYALNAGNAEMLGGKPLSAFMLTDGVQPRQLWKGDASKSSGNEVFVSALGGTGTSGKIAKWTDNSGNLGDSVLSEAGGNVGLGTAVPGNLFHINSTAGPNVSQFRITSNDAGSLSALTYSADNVALGFDVDYSAGFRARSTTGALIYKNGGFLRFTGDGGLTPGDTFAQSDRLVLDLTTGNFGVGATLPKSRLNIASVNSVFVPDLLFTFDQAGNYRHGIANTFSSASAANNIMTFRVSDSSTAGHTTVMSLNGAGNVGIGTFFPTARLSVVGDVNVSSGTISGNGSGLTNISAANVSGNGSAITNVNAATLSGQPASAFATRGITYLGGCDTCSVLADTDDQKTIYLNVVGDMTINSVTCFSDAGNPTINLQRDSGGSPADVLTAPLACSPTGTTSTTFTTNLLSANHKLDFVLVSAGGVAKRVTVAIKATVN
jgi:hypothetical protein